MLLRTRGCGVAVGFVLYQTLCGTVCLCAPGWGGKGKAWGALAPELVTDLLGSAGGVLWDEGSSLFKDKFIQDHYVTLVLPQVLVPLVLSLWEAAMGTCLWGLAWSRGAPGCSTALALGILWNPAEATENYSIYSLCLTLAVALCGRWIMYYRLVSLSGLSALAEAVPEEAAAPWRLCPWELSEPAVPCLGLSCLVWAADPGLGSWLPKPSAPEEQDCCADGKLVILPLGCV